MLNGVFHTQRTDDPIAVALETRGRAALEDMPGALRNLPRIDIPLLPFGLVGVDALRQMGTGGEFSRHTCRSRLGRPSSTARH